MLDLTNVFYLMEKDRESGNPRNYRVGVVMKNISGMVACHEKGSVVVFRVNDPSRASERERLFWDRDRSGDPVTIVPEAPYHPKAIDQAISEGSSIFSHSPIVGTPLSCVREIKGLELTARRYQSRLRSFLRV
jgi:hypothetical protein